METFAPGDRVVAINIECGPMPLKSLAPHDAHPFLLPDGPLRDDVIYHVRRISYTRDGCQGVYLTGLRTTWGDINVPWCATRFRKVDALKGHVPQARRQKNPVASPVGGEGLMKMERLLQQDSIASFPWKLAERIANPPKIDSGLI